MGNLLALTMDEYNVMVINSMLLCFIFLCALFICHSRHWFHKFKNDLFFVYLFTVLTLIGEITWMFVDGEKDLIWLNYIANMFSLGGCSFIGYFWLMYCFKSFPDECFKKTWIKLIFTIPVIIMFSLVVLSPFIQQMFYIDDKGVYHRGPLFLLQSLGYIYVLVASTIAVLSIKKVYLSVEKTHLRIIIYAAIPCIIIGGVQFFLPAGGLPYFQFSMFLSLCGIFVHDEERQITVDMLTKLKTRYEFEKILYDKIKKFRNNEDKKLFVIAGDINDFKSINDNYGHDEGDVAICRVGDIMDQVANSHKALACRRSGDEFLISVEGNDNKVTDNIISSINKELKKFNDTKEYNLSLSFGVAQYDGKENLRALLDRADNIMYIEKKKLRKN